MALMLIPWSTCSTRRYERVAQGPPHRRWTGTGRADQQESKMRVCHVCSLHTADDNRVFHQECRTLAEVGYDVHLLAIAGTSQPYTDQRVTIHPLPPCSRLESFARRSSVARMAAELQPDLFHVHEPELLG